MRLPFIKMHGAGNDFVIFDARDHPFDLTPEQVQAIAARSNEVTKGCDQVIVVESAQEANAFMRIYNADGGEVNACGNATRCVGWLLMEENSLSRVSIRTKADILHASSDGGNQVTVDMGEPKFRWQDIPLARKMDTLHTGIRVSDALTDPVAVSMGNPHAVFFVDDPKLLETADMARVSQVLQPLYPEGVNVSIAFVRENNLEASAVIDVRVWERGVGETPACGTAACAVMAAAWRRTPVANTVEIHFWPHGHILHVAWQDKDTCNNILLSGPVEVEFEGEIDV